MFIPVLGVAGRARGGGKRGDSANTLADVPEELKLTESEFEDLRSWVDRSLASSDLGWPDVFQNLRAAREFKRRFMPAVPGVHLIGLVIPADDAEEFMPLITKVRIGNDRLEATAP